MTECDSFFWLYVLPAINFDEWQGAVDKGSNWTGKIFVSVWVGVNVAP